MAVVRRFALALLVGLLWSMRLGAQAPTGTITGRVVDATSQQGVADVSVFVEGTRRGAVTAADGSFTIGGVPAGAQTVRARRIGFNSPAQVVNVPANGSASVVLTAERQAVSLEDVVTTGYGTQRRVAITGSVATVDADKANVGVTTNVNQMIEGRAAGVQITTNSGEPGAGAQVTIRGGSSISASNEPLYVIDGVPINNTETENAGIGIGGDPPLPRSPLSLINPADIASISILKDAAAAIYGTRAANGVVLIETKKGLGSGPSVQYDFYIGSSWAPKQLDLLTGDQFRAYVDQQVAAGNMTATQRASLGTANTDWQSELFRHAATFNHDLSFAGGSATTQYRASVNYMNQEGVVISSGFKRLQARINGTHQALDGRLRLGANLTGSNINNDYIPFENRGGFEGGLFINMVQFNPTKPVTVVDTAIGGVTRFYELSCAASTPQTTCANTAQSDRNPVGLANQIQAIGKTNRVLGNGTVDFDIFTPLTARILAGVDRSDGNRSDYWPLASPAGAGFGGRARQAERTLLSKTFQSVLTFHPEFSSNHSFDMLGGYEYNDYDLSEFVAEAQGFLTDALG